MAAVPQRTLNWLYSILIRDHYDPKQTYQDPNRAYYDVANALAQYPSLSPRTDVYTYETGFSTLLLLLAGTVPVSFRGNLYKFPIEVWIPTNYPCEPPMVYVTPTKDMVVRAGQHVTLEGRVYHHYLAHWMEAWDRATLVEFLSILRDVFAIEPPVKYKPTPQQPAPLSMPTPPPVPPLPPGFGSSTSSPAMASPPAPGPPPPPKPGQAERQMSPGYSSPPPLPPLPREELERRSITRPGPSHVYSHSWNQPPNQYQTYQHPGQPQPARVPQPQPGPARAPIPQPQPGPGPVPGPAQQLAQQPAPAPAPIPQPQPQLQLQPQQQPQPAPAQVPGQGQPTKPEPPTDLLTSPFDVDLPSFHPPTSALPPPIPPNPEKHALQSAVSKAVSETLLSNTSQSASAAHALSAQSHSLHVAVAAVQAEITSLNGLNSALQENTGILKDSLVRADGVISDAKCRLSSSSSSIDPGISSADPSASTGPASTGPGTGPEGQGLPPIDEILVAPTVVEKQLYDLIAEEAGIQQAIYALQGALVKGVIGAETWSRHTRGLAREAFLKRALTRKVAGGLGLSLE